MTSRIGLSLLMLVVAAGCAGRDSTDPTNTQRRPVRSAGSGPTADKSESFPRSGALHVTKECSQYTGKAGDFCTITSSNVKEIEVGSKVIYSLAAGPSVLDTDVTLDPPRPGDNKAFGHCHLDLSTGAGQCSLSGGTGKFTHLSARADVSYLGGPNWAWNGSYSFDPRN